MCSKEKVTHVKIYFYSVRSIFFPHSVSKIPLHILLEMSSSNFPNFNIMCNVRERDNHEIKLFF